MSVRLAVQLFSGSTASAMEIYSKQEGCQKLHNSAGTYDFTKQMNDLFDCLNSRTPQDVQYNEAEHIATLKANIKWLEDCCTYIESLPKQRQVCFLSKPTCGALRITLHSMVALIDRLLKSGFRYVLVVNLGQDPLEEVVHIFGVDTLAVLLHHVLLEPTTDCVEDIGPLSTKDSISEYLGGYGAKN
ncbi:uncharacterized protein LOC144159739 [Haemaphysalis longicornis]